MSWYCLLAFFLSIIQKYTIQARETKFSFKKIPDLQSTWSQEYIKQNYSIRPKICPLRRVWLSVKEGWGGVIQDIPHEFAHHDV
jgi:hypothetical protein